MAYRKSTKRIAKKKQQRKRLLVSLFLLVLALIVGAVFLLRADYFQVTKITISQTTYTDVSLVEQFVENTINKKFLLIIPKKQRLFIDESQLEASIEKAFPTVRGVEIHYQSLQELVIVLQEREESLVLKQGDVLFSLDTEGYIFRQSRVEDSDSNQELLFTSKKSYRVTDLFLKGESLQELETLISQLQQRGLNIQEVRESSDFTLALITAGDTRIVIPVSDNYDDIYSKLVKLFATTEFSFNKETGDFIKDYAYINLQQGNKVFSCLLTSECKDNYK